MDEVTLTEKYVSDKLIAVAKDFGVNAPRVVIAKRATLKPSQSLNRLVTFALIVPLDVDGLLDALIKQCLDDNMSYYFVGSDVNLQGNLDVEYLYFEADIMPHFEN